MMIIPVLGMLKKSSISILKTIKVKIGLLEKENKMSLKNVFIHPIFKITTKVLMIGKSLYLRSGKLTNNLKAGTFKHFSPLILIKKKRIYYNHT